MTTLNKLPNLPIKNFPGALGNKTISNSCWNNFVSSSNALNFGEDAIGCLNNNYSQCGHMACGSITNSEVLPILVGLTQSPKIVGTVTSPKSLEIQNTLKTSIFKKSKPDIPIIMLILFIIIISIVIIIFFVKRRRNAFIIDR